MFASTILLRRLFSSKPSQKEMDFHWWFVTRGIKDWQRFLAAKGFSMSKRSRVIKDQETRSRKLLEVWDTEMFRTWDQTGQGRHVDPEVLGADAVPHIMSAQQVWAGPTTGHGPAFDAYPRPSSFQDRARLRGTHD